MYISTLILTLNVDGFFAHEPLMKIMECTRMYIICENTGYIRVVALVSVFTVSSFDYVISRRCRHRRA